MRITKKGQVTIPKEHREKFGFLPGTELYFIAESNGLRLIKSQKLQGKLLIEHMRGLGDGKLSTDKIMRLTRER